MFRLSRAQLLGSLLLLTVMLLLLAARLFRLLL